MRTALLVFSFLACAFPGKSAGAGDGPPSVSAETPIPPADRKALFESLLKSLRTRHVFAPQTEKNLGRKWEDDRPLLEKEFAAADTLGKLRAALSHLGNSLHDRHCFYEPEERPDDLWPGFSIASEWNGGQPSFYIVEVEDPALSKLLVVGDRVVSVDGVAATEFLSRYQLESRANSLRGMARDVAQFLTQRPNWGGSLRAGQTSTWVVRRRGTEQAVSFRATWRLDSPVVPQRSPDYAVVYRETQCGELPQRKYPGYHLTGRGINYCLYTSTTAPYSAYPIVRHYSFLYGTERQPPWVGVEKEYYLLKAHLAAQKDLRGIILDLRDNTGGNNPNWFLDWYAPAPWRDEWVVERKQDGSYAPPHPFFCPVEHCTTSDYVPKHRVARLTVARLVGPRCFSACDSFALTFEENRFGPLIGEPTAAGYTSMRQGLPLRTKSGVPLGQLLIGTTKQLSGKTGLEVEAVSLHLDYPIDRGFDNHDTYDRLLVDTAIRAFTEYKFPASTTGP